MKVADELVDSAQFRAAVEYPREIGLLGFGAVDGWADDDPPPVACRGMYVVVGCWRFLLTLGLDRGLIEHAGAPPARALPIRALTGQQTCQ
jgi:hypothetical protein